jgi:hypothetical protein
VQLSDLKQSILDMNLQEAIAVVVAIRQNRRQSKKPLAKPKKVETKLMGKIENLTADELDILIKNLEEAKS